MGRKGSYPRAACRHCRRVLTIRAVGLCWTCARTPAVRRLYPRTSKFARRDGADFCGAATLPAEPTAELPATEGKVLEMQRRASRQEVLFHAGDAQRSCA